MRKAKQVRNKASSRGRAKALAQALPAELKQLLDRDYDLVSHYEAGSSSSLRLCHTVLLVRKRFGYQNTFSYDFDAVATKYRQSDDCDWSDTDIYDDLRELGWDFVIVPATNEVKVYS